MPRANQLLLSTLGALVLATLAWGFYASIEFYEETEKSAWSPRALLNPYLAAQQFLKTSEVKVVEADSLLSLDSLDGVSTVLITSANQVGNPRQLKSVLDWLENGGSLIVTANTFSDSRDLLLEEFNVDVSWPDENTEDADEEEDQQKQSMSDSLRDYNKKIGEGMTAEEIAQAGKKEMSLTQIAFDDDIGTLEIEFNLNRVLSHPYITDESNDSDVKPFSWSSSEKGVHLMQFDVGDGLLTFMSDTSIWTSQNIDRHDHAYLLWVLSSTDGDFAILRTTRRDSLWMLVSENAGELLIALGLFIVFWLWYIGHRFGRIVPLDSRERRALSEHFSATANYLWHRKASSYLIQPLRQQIFRRARIAIPEFSRADPEKRLELIAQHCKINRVTVGEVLQASEFNESSFVYTVKLLKHIEQSL